MGEGRMLVKTKRKVVEQFHQTVARLGEWVGVFLLNHVVGFIFSKEHNRAGAEKLRGERDFLRCFVTNCWVPSLAAWLHAVATVLSESSKSAA